MSIRILNFKDLAWGTVTCFILFWYVYSPNLIFIPISVDKILLLLFLVWAALWHRNQVFKIFSQKDVFLIFASYFLIFVYTFALDLLVIDGVSISYHVGQYFLQYIPFSILLFVFMHSIYGERCVLKLYKFLLILIFLQSLLGLAMFLGPELKTSIYKIQAEDGKMYKGILTRGNGYASGLLFSIPIIHGVMVSTVLLCRLPGSIFLKMIFVFLVTVMALTNARMALVPIIIALPILAFRFFSYSGIKASIRAVFASILFFSLMTILLPSDLVSSELLDSVSIISAWVIGGYANVFGIEVSGNQQMIADYLINDSTYLDDSVTSLLFGTGVNAFSAIKNQSDIGIINLIRFGGFFYFGAVLFVTYYLVWKAFTMARSHIFRVLILLLGITYFAASLKGIVFNEQLLGRFLVLICLFAIIDFMQNHPKNIGQSTAKSKI